ncbi:MAG: PaaI family thioesterase, partial [Burkholderiales bacterium]
NLLPVTNETVKAVYNYVFAPWVKELGLNEMSAGNGQAIARLPLNAALTFSSGPICGQAIMAAVDTVMTLAMLTTERPTKGTVYQHTHFLRPAVGDDLRIEAKVLKFGKTTAYAEASVSYASSGELVARSTAAFAF